MTISVLLILSLIPTKNKQSVVEHLDDVNIIQYKEIQQTDLPIFIRGNIPWRYSCLIPYLNDESRIIFIKDYSEIINNYFEMIPCIYLNQTDDSEQYHYVSETFNLRKLESVSYHDVYLINLKLIQ